MSKRLLLADDSITIQKVIQITFAHEDYELTITDNGDAALAKAQEIKPDLVMSDVYMPGKNGYELTTAIKQDPALQNVPVLLLAGSFEPFDEDKARSCKADAWIEKPFESQNLIDKVAELLSAAPQAEVAPAAESVAPVAEAPAEPVAELPVDDSPLDAFDESFAEESAPAEAEMVSAPAEDPFGDISFEEETPAVEPVPEAASEPEPVAIDDDWSDVSAEPEPVAEEVFSAPEEAFVAEPAFTAEEAADDVFATDEAPVAEAELDVFDMGEDEIMPLGDDDILGAEDLEPAPEEPTLAAWSRSSADEDDVFAEDLAEEEPALEEDVFAPADEPVLDEPSAFVEEEPVAEVAFEEPVAEVAAFEDAPEESAPAFVEETPAFEESSPVFEEEVPAPVAAVAAADVEAKAASMSEDDLEKIIEKVVEKVVEKLAGSILEKVAWEVVPDMAENLIREEIRKIKDAAA